tara:strand:- start:2187 stop:3143 length:957 start_codon:yes stop_codon:yes gene_type:complete
MTNTLIDYNRRDINIRTDKVEEALPEYFSTDFPTLQSFLNEYYNFMGGDDSSGATHNFNEEVKNLYRNRDIQAASLKNLNQLIFEIGNELTAADIFTEPRFAATRLAKFYRKKGSVESLKEFFRLFFGEEIIVSYPKKDLFVVGESKIGYENQKFIRNNSLYQLYSILITSGLATQTWQELYKKFVHPAGWYFQGQVSTDGIGSLSLAAPLSIAGTVDPIFGDSAEVFETAPFTLLTTLVDSSGTSIRTTLDDTIAKYQSLSLGSLQNIGYENIAELMNPTSPTFDDDSDASLLPLAGKDFSNIIETMDQNIFGYDSA